MRANLLLSTRPPPSTGGGGGGGGGGVLRPIFLWENGGGIFAWTIWPFDTGIAVSYAPIGNTSVIGAYDFELCYSAVGGTYKIRWEYDADRDIVVTPRVRSVGSVWSSSTAQTLSFLVNVKEFTITLAAGEALGMHANPQGGAVNLNYCRAFLGPA